METIQTAMDAAYRQVFGKVEITYTDPFNDESLSIHASDTQDYTSVNYLIDSVTEPAYKWFSLHDNKLDGSYHPMPTDNSYSVGWWDNKLSDANGYIADPPVLTVVFAERSLTTLQVVGDSKLNCFPVDFNIYVYDADDNVLYSKNVVGNTQVVWDHTMEPVMGSVKMELVITRINKPNSSAKLLELFTAVVQTYDGELLESINLLEEIGYHTGSIPIGNISANEIDIVISNADRRFDLLNEQSPLHGYIKRNRRVRVWFGAMVNGEIEWVPMGTFWTTAWDITRSSLVASLTARDRLDLLRLTTMRAPVFVNKSLYELYEYVLLDAGLKYVEFDIDPGLQDIVIPYAWLDDLTHREALTRLSKCAIVQVYCSRDNKIIVNKDLDASPTVTHTFDDDVNVYNTKQPIAVSEQVNHVEVVHKQWSPTANVEVYNSEEALSVPMGESVSYFVSFSRFPVTAISSPIITTTGTISVESYNLYATGAEITFKNTGSSNGTVTAIKINGTLLEERSRGSVIAKDDVSIREDGKIGISINDDLIQSLPYATQLANNVLTTFLTSRHDITLENMGNVAAGLRDQVLYKDVYGNAPERYMVVRQQFFWNGALMATTECKSYSP